MNQASSGVERFFGPGNRLTLDVGEAGPRLRELRDDIDRALPRPVVLPRMREGTDVIDWYVLAGGRRRRRS